MTTAPLRLAVVGLAHGHVEWLLDGARTRRDIELVGIWEPDAKLFDRLAEKYQTDPALRATDLGAMLDETKPDAAAVMTHTAAHEMAVEACAPRGVHVMVEKPLAITPAGAEQMTARARRHGVHLLTNYETSWYPSLRTAKRLLDSGKLGRLLEARYLIGHQGPVQNKLPGEFLAWLLDPELNGGGAMADFACYGVVLTGWLIGETPDSVSATTRTVRPDLYPRVEDDSEVSVSYPGGAKVTIRASWALEANAKACEFVTDAGVLRCPDRDRVVFDSHQSGPREIVPDPLDPELTDAWTYLRSVVVGGGAIDEMSATDANLGVVRVLAGARASAASGEPVRVRC